MRRDIRKKFRLFAAGLLKKHCVLWASLATLWITSAHAALWVVGNPSIALNQLTRDELKGIYLQKPVTLSNGEQLLPFDQSPDSPRYTSFYQYLLHWNNAQLTGYRSLLLNEGIEPPVQLAQDLEVMATVSRTPDAIGYVDSKSVNAFKGKLKVLYAFSGNRPSSLKQTVVTMSDGLPRNDEAPSPKKTSVVQQKPKDERAEAMREVQALNASLPHGVAVPTNMIPLQNDAWGVLAEGFKLEQGAHSSEVQFYIQWFLAHPNVLHRMLNNAKPYLYYVMQVVKAQNMPTEFALLPMIESGYDPFAYSYAGASGLWQLMPGTATRQGLAFNWWYDGRADIVDSTRAALSFLKAVYINVGRDWLLAAAAYNTGAGVVLAAERRSGKHDFWSLKLSQQTQAYVPKLLALAKIIATPSRYGVTLPRIPNEPYFASVQLKAQLDLQEMSNLAEIPVSRVRALNPGIRHWAIAPGVPYTLYLPIKSIERFRKNLAKLSGQAHASWAYHEVQPQETLKKIAHNYRTTESLLKRVNALTSSEIVAHEGLVVPLYLQKRYGSHYVSSKTLAPMAYGSPASSESGITARRPYQAESLHEAGLKGLMSDLYQ